jgi:DnaJ-class molecular chaperone
MRRDYYAVLGIAPTAAPREVRQAYRRLARQYSPDVNFWDQGARPVFEEIAEAYRVLGDPEARALYDRIGEAVRGGGRLGAGQRGEDLHVTIDVAFADATRGLVMRLEVMRFSRCDPCGATGIDGDRACGACLGRGVRRRPEPVSVVLPAGVEPGTELRVPGEGSAGPFGGPRGDLVVTVRVAEHPFFKRRGHNLHCEVPISVWEALRGARIPVPTPAGQGILVVPPGTAPGQVFRLRGQGLPKLSGEGDGDLHVTVRVEMPAGLDASTDGLVRELERLLPVNPRAGLGRYQGGST